MATGEVAVLIVGGGPTGLCTSIALSRLGVPSLLVERHDAISPFSRARAVHRRAMEIFRTWGLDDAIHDRELDLEPMTQWSDSVASPPTRRLPYVVRSDPALSPCRMSPIFQDELERVLLARAASEDAAELRFSTEFRGLRQGPERIEATLRDRRTGAEYQVRARYLIGADGAASTVRRRLGIAMQGPGELADNLLIRFRADLGRWAGERPPYFFFLSGAPARVLMMVGRDHVWALNAMDPARGSDPAAVVRAAIGAEVPVEILGVATWTAAAQVAERFRDGRAFLVGDAAHRMPPAGAMGMNTGIHDAHNLAWKLAAVLDGWAGEGLLGTYEAERRPAALRNVAWSLDNWNCLRAGEPWPPPGNPNTEAIDLGAVYDSAAVVPDGTPPPAETVEYMPTARPGSRAPHVWIGADRERRSTIDLFDGGFVLLTGTEGTGWLAAAQEAARSLGVPLRALIVDEPAWQTAYGVGPAGAMVVRPDGHVAWRARGGPADASGVLDDGLRRVLGHEVAHDEGHGHTG